MSSEGYARADKHQEIKEVQFESEVCYRHYRGYLPSTCLFWTWLKLNMRACGCSRVLHLTVGFETPVGTCFSCVCALLNSYTTSKCVCWRESWLKQKLCRRLSRELFLISISQETEMRGKKWNLSIFFMFTYILLYGLLSLNKTTCVCVCA